ncbi:MAG TPA: hypothetical protein VGF58_08770 [Burkholderiales bacterium]|jgi:hypothetical protein
MATAVTMKESKKVAKRTDQYAVYERIVGGLERRPAYLLLFGIAALFVIEGLATSVAGVVKDSLPMGLLGLASFVIALGAVIIVVYRVEPSRERLQVKVGEVAVAVQPVSAPPVPTPQTYQDSERGFRFDLPSQAGWSKPALVPITEHLARVLLLPKEINLEQFGQKLQETLRLHPLGDMISQSKVLALWHGDEIRIETTPTTTVPGLEKFVNDAAELAKKQGEEFDSAQVRKAIISQKYPQAFGLQNVFAVTIFQKRLAANPILEPTLPNLFAITQQYAGGPIEKLAANDTSILTGRRMQLIDVLVNGEKREITVYGLSHLTENADFFFEVGINYCPQGKQSPDLWTEMQRMIGSFRVMV